MAATTTHGTKAADTEYLTRNAMNLGYQFASLLVPPVYLAVTLASPSRRATFSVNRLLRTTWIGGLGGCITAGGLAYGWYATTDELQLRNKRFHAAYDTSQLRANDHATIGGILMAVATPAIFWKRASVVNLILGGAGVGTGIGLLTHYGRLITGDVPPKPELPAH